jgi:signal transduction histidine kinase
MRRTLLVVALLLVAAGVPFTAWFVSGSRETEREAARITDEAQRSARMTAQALAAHLGEQLEALRASESQRPYFHYQNLMHDPRGASQGLSVVPSPLAQGPADPLILTHFQIDAQGHVTMPTINDDVRELNAPDVARQQSIRIALRSAAAQILRDGGPRLASLKSEIAARSKSTQATVPSVQAAVAPPAKPPSTRPESPAQSIQTANTSTATAASVASATPLRTDPAPPRVTRTDLLQNNIIRNVGQQNLGQQSVLAGQQNLQQAVSPGQEANVSGVTIPQPQVAEPPKLQKLDPAAFAQNAQSNVVYNELKTAAPQKKSSLPPRHAPEVEIASNDFAWRAIELSGRPALAALRPVVTPDGAFVQGFVIADDALTGVLRSTPYVRLHRGPGPFPIAGTGWSLDVDAGTAASLMAKFQAAQIRRAFRRTFYAGLGAALLAVVALAWLVWRTERLARERSQFAAAAAHELRTPLAGLRLYGDMLAHQLGDPERSRAYARHMSEEADRLGRVVANMLEFTSLERGSLTIKPQPGDLGHAVREFVDQLRPALEVAGCSIQLSIDDDLHLTVPFDRDAVQHIVQNLLDNAEKYSRPSSDRQVDVDVGRLNGQAALTVSDRGAGLDARTARHLFLPFERGASGDGPAGLGLGLVLVKALAEAHGGGVTWSPRDGGGTTFCVRLPLFYTP